MGLNHSIVRLCGANRDGSFATQADRLKTLTAAGKQLRSLGLRLQDIRNIKPKHVEKLVSRWQAERLAAGTLKNRLAHIRWAAERVGKPDIVRPTNSEYGIENRVHVSVEKTEARISGFQSGQLDKIRDPYTRFSIELEAAFGLRREAAIKFQPHLADRGDHVLLKASWTKGGKQVQIPIRNLEQRRLLEQVKSFTAHSLIPPEKTYVQQVKIFEREALAAGFGGTHGARYLYAQTRYLEITGFEPTRFIGQDQRRVDTIARETISRELGHERIQVVSIYLGV